MTGKANLAAPILARLLNRAKETGDDHQTLLASYCLERFLYRLGVSDRRERFVLKGAMLLRLWSDRPYRATRDLHLLRSGDGASDAIQDDLQAIVATPVPPDAVTFDAEHIQIEAIRAEDEHAGARATMTARCGRARAALQIDMGLGDAVWPAPQPCTYPTLLDSPAPELLAHPREAVVAEKLEAMVVLGDRNSRIKDFFDLHHLATRFEFDRATLSEAVRRTFERRHTPIPADDPSGLTPMYWKIRRDRRRCGHLRAGRVSRFPRSRPRSSCDCCMRSSRRCWRIYGTERGETGPGEPEDRGGESVSPASRRRSSSSPPCAGTSSRTGRTTRE